MAMKITIFCKCELGIPTGISFVKCSIHSTFQYKTNDNVVYILNQKTQQLHFVNVIF